MDFAIALSLQQHNGSEAGIQQLQQGLSSLQGMRNAVAQMQHAHQQLHTASSVGASASAAGSDDEGSNVATDGSTLRTSPAEPVGSGGSESGGSGVESIGGISGRSSTYGDGVVNASPPRTNSNLTNVNCSKTAMGERSGSTAMDAASTTTHITSDSVQNNDIVENDGNKDEKAARLHELR